MRSPTARGSLPRERAAHTAASSPFLAANELSEPMNRLMPQIFEGATAVRPGLQEIEQTTNAKLEPAARAAKA